MCFSLVLMLHRVLDFSLHFLYKDSRTHIHILILHQNFVILDLWTLRLSLFTTFYTMGGQAYAFFCLGLVLYRLPYLIIHFL